MYIQHGKMTDTAVVKQITDLWKCLVTAVRMDLISYSSPVLKQVFCTVKV